MSDAMAIVTESDHAHEHRSPWEAITVTFECGHLTLMPKVRTVMGVGAIGGCRVCWELLNPAGDDGSVARMVCKLEPTGHLHDDFLKR